MPKENEFSKPKETPEEISPAKPVQSKEEIELIARLKEKLSAFLEKKGIREYIAWWGKCLEIIKKKYPDSEASKYRLWHVLSGGSGYEDSPEFDFPDECSIQKMIEKLEI